MPNKGAHISREIYTFKKILDSESEYVESEQALYLYFMNHGQGDAELRNDSLKYKI